MGSPRNSESPFAEALAKAVFGDLFTDPSIRYNPTWTYHQCWVALGAFKRSALIQTLVAPSTVATLGFWHERGRNGEIAGV